LSVKAKPNCETVLAAGLAMVKESVVLELIAIVLPPNASLIAGGATTLTVAWLLAEPNPPSFDVILPVTLF